MSLYYSSQCNMTDWINNVRWLREIINETKNASNPRKKNYSLRHETECIASKRFSKNIPDWWRLNSYSHNYRLFCLKLIWVSPCTIHSNTHAYNSGTSIYLLKLTYFDVCSTIILEKFLFTQPQHLQSRRHHHPLQFIISSSCNDELFEMFFCNLKITPATNDFMLLPPIHNWNKFTPFYFMVFVLQGSN